MLSMLVVVLCTAGADIQTATKDGQLFVYAANEPLEICRWQGQWSELREVKPAADDPRKDEVRVWRLANPQDLECLQVREQDYAKTVYWLRKTDDGYEVASVTRTPYAETSEGVFTKRINQHRQAHGLQPVSYYYHIEQLAEENNRRGGKHAYTGGCAQCWASGCTALATTA